MALPFQWRQRRTNQPGQFVAIDGSNPLSRDLSLGIHFGNGQASYDFVTGKTNGIVGTRARVAAGGAAGMGFGATLGTAATDWVSSTYIGAVQKKTYLAFVYTNGSGGGALGRLWDKSNSSCYTNGSASIIFFSRNFSTTQQTIQFSLPAGQANCFAFTSDGSNPANAPLIYVNGIPVTKTAGNNGAGTASDGGGALYFGNTVAGNRALDGQIFLTMWWDRLLTPNELADVTRNPWQVFAAPVAVNPRLGAADGGAIWNFSVSEVGSANDTADGSALTAAAAAEAGTALDVVAQTSVGALAVVDALATADALAALAARGAALVEAGAAQDAAAAAQVAQAQVAEASVAADAAALLATALQTVAESGVALETVGNAAGSSASQVEVGNAADVQAAVALTSTSQDEVGDVEDVVGQSLAAAVATTEQVQAQDAPSSMQRSTVVIVEAATLVDVVVPALFHGQLVSDGLTVVDHPSATSAGGVAQAEALAVDEETDGVDVLAVTLDESVLAIDEVLAASLSELALVEALNATETIDNLIGFLGTLDEELNAVDQVAAANLLVVLAVTNGFLATLQARTWRVTALPRNWTTRK